jgi:hypothetical protein
MDWGSSGVSVRVDLDKSEPHYQCTFNWTVTFADGSTQNGSCTTDVANGVQNGVACSREYGKAVKSATLTGSNCKAK